MKKFQNIIAVVGTVSVCLVPVISLLAIWSDFTEIAYKLLASAMIILFSCMFIDKCIDAEKKSRKKKKKVQEYNESLKE